jgi:CO/xanthine dehydrogenase FAD-binding subunit
MPAADPVRFRPNGPPVSAPCDDPCIPRDAVYDLAGDGIRRLRIAPGELRLAVGGADPFPRRFDERTDAVVGAPLSDERVRGLAEEIARRVRPGHNTFLLADYRRTMVSVYVRCVIAEARSGVAG